MLGINFHSPISTLCGDGSRLARQHRLLVPPEISWHFVLTSEGMVVHPFFFKKITNAYTNFLGTKVFSPCFQIDISLLS
jgi:hypothetical protein